MSIANPTSSQHTAHDAAYLAAIVQNSDDAIVSKTLEGIIQSWNDAATELYGYTADEAIGQPIEIVIPETKRDEELKFREQIASGVEVRHTETIRRRRDGSLIPVSLSISPVKNPDGEIIAAAGFARDMTERNEAFETQQRLAAIVLNSHEAIVSKTLRGEILSWNEAATRMYGYTESEAIGQPIEIIIPEDRRLEELEIRGQIQSGTPVQRYETVRRRKDGSLLEVSLSISPVKNAGGEIIGAAGFARDITESRRFERLAEIVIRSGDAIVVKNLDSGRIEDWNDAATEMYGYVREEAIGQPIEILIPEHLRKAEVEQRSKIKKGEEIPHHETVRRHRNGTLIDVSLSISPIRDAAGNVVAAARIARDISERKRLEKEREHATGLLERFVDFTTHDFKTPLHHAVLYAQQARRTLGSGADPEVLELLDIVISNARWMSRRTEGLLKAVSLKGRRTVLKDVDVGTIFDESVAMLKSVYDVVEEANIHRGELPIVHSDDHLLAFLFQNLVHNACKYKQEEIPADIELSAYMYAGGWEFALADNGRGIPPELAEEIFEPYTRGADIERVAGLGIGLHFCKLIVEWHGGRIWVDPGPGGIGSAFKFTIPN
jgi:PAS domain S-box-containing protein